MSVSQIRIPVQMIVNKAAIEGSMSASVPITVTIESPSRTYLKDSSFMSALPSCKRSSLACRLALLVFHRPRHSAHSGAK